MEIRFASIPKCASRSLKALGLLGELDGRCHTKITEYPDWQKYHWMAVDRPAEDWYRSWWEECKRTKSMFADWLGFKYESMSEDLKKLHFVSGEIVKKGIINGVPHEEYYISESKGEAPRRPGLNAWIPEEFRIDFGQERFFRGDEPQTFKEYCFDIITDGVPCEIIQLEDLDDWLRAHGFEPIHMNAREENATA